MSLLNILLLHIIILYCVITKWNWPNW